MYIFILCVCGVIIITSELATGRVCRSAALSAFQGATALFAVNFVGDFIGVHLALNFFSVAVSAAGGLPGVIFLLVSDIITKVNY